MRVDRRHVLHIREVVHVLVRELKRIYLAKLISGIAWRLYDLPHILYWLSAQPFVMCWCCSPSIFRPWHRRTSAFLVQFRSLECFAGNLLSGFRSRYSVMRSSWQLAMCVDPVAAYKTGNQQHKDHFPDMRCKHSPDSSVTSVTFSVRTSQRWIDACSLRISMLYVIDKRMEQWWDSPLSESKAISLYSLLKQTARIFWALLTSLMHTELMWA